MHDLKHAQPAVPAIDLHPPAGPGPGAGLAPEELTAPPPGAPKPRARRPRRGRWAGEGPMPPIERKRLAAIQLRKAFSRIKADFSEAYEQCRTDAQRRALEIAHLAVKEAFLRAMHDSLLEDSGGWTSALGEIRGAKDKADRALARLVTADAVVRILKRLALIETLLGALSA